MFRTIPNHVHVSGCSEHRWLDTVPSTWHLYQFIKDHLMAIVVRGHDAVIPHSVPNGCDKRVLSLPKGCNRSTMNTQCCCTGHQQILSPQILSPAHVTRRYRERMSLAGKLLGFLRTGSSSRGRHSQACTETPPTHPKFCISWGRTSFFNPGSSICSYKPFKSLCDVTGTKPPVSTIPGNRGRSLVTVYFILLTLKMVKHDLNWNSLIVDCSRGC